MRTRLGNQQHQQEQHGADYDQRNTEFGPAQKNLEFAMSLQRTRKKIIYQHNSHNGKSDEQVLGFALHLVVQRHSKRCQYAEFRPVNKKSDSPVRGNTGTYKRCRKKQQTTKIRKNCNEKVVLQRTRRNEFKIEF